MDLPTPSLPRTDGEGSVSPASSVVDIPERVVRGRVFHFAWRPLISAGVLLLADWLAVFFCFAVCWELRAGPLPRLFSGFDPPLGFSAHLSSLYGLAPWPLALAESHLYTRRALFWDETRRILRAATMAAVLAGFLSFADHSVDTLSRLVIAGTWLGSLLLLPLTRYGTKRLLWNAGVWGKRVLIVGAGETGAQVHDRIKANPVLGYEPVAFVDDDAHKIGRELNGLRVRGPLRAIPALVHELQVKDLVLAMPGLPREQLLPVIALCEGHVESIRVVPDMYGVASVGVETEDLDGVLLLHMRWNLAKPWNEALKRVFDLFVAAVTAVLLAPVLLLAALAIRLDSPGPILFVQERIGRGRRPFRCFKFRTMYVDSDARLRAYLAQHPESRFEWEHFAKLKSFDPRVTRVGHVLRRLSFDELPQLVNVWRHQMSLVGPRPYLPSERERMGDFAETILKAQPGITGLWQVSGRNTLSFEQRLRLDEYYVRNWSLWVDIVVLVKTIGAVLRRDGAY